MVQKSKNNFTISMAISRVTFEANKQIPRDIYEVARVRGSSAGGESPHFLQKKNFCTFACLICICFCIPNFICIFTGICIFDCNCESPPFPPRKWGIFLPEHPIVLPTSVTFFVHICFCLFVFPSSYMGGEGPPFLQRK